MDCIFCKIINKEVPGTILYEDDEVLAFMDIKPVNFGHLLVIPKKHAALFSDVEDSTVAKMNVVAKKLNTAIRKSGLKAEGVNLFLADGEAAGQEVFHVHLHVIPRFKNDGFGLKFPDHYNDKKEMDEIKAAADKIKAAL